MRGMGWGGMCGRGACMALEGHAWGGGMLGRGHVWQGGMYGGGGACMAGVCVWQGIPALRNKI